jgi:hypothetical protein
MKYERVTYRPEGERARTIYLENPEVRGELLTGVQVKADGDEVSGKGFDERRHIISLELVTSRVPMRMDNIYGELVEA